MSGFAERNPPPIYNSAMRFAASYPLPLAHEEPLRKDTPKPGATAINLSAAGQRIALRKSALQVTSQPCKYRGRIRMADYGPLKYPCSLRN